MLTGYHLAKAIFLFAFVPHCLPIEIFESLRPLSGNSLLLHIHVRDFPQNQTLRFTFSPELRVGIHFEYVEPFANLNLFYQNITEARIVTLRRNQVMQEGANSSTSWLANTASEGALKIVAIHYHDTTINLQNPITVAAVVPPSKCPSNYPASFPHLSAPLKLIVEQVTQLCLPTSFFLSSQLEDVDSKIFGNDILASEMLLYHEPPLLFIDASDQAWTSALKSVDSWLARHSVLQLVWEPLAETDPRWFLVMPHK
jgi:hypothetical protein